MRVYCSADIAVALGAKPFGAKTPDVPHFLVVTPTGLFTIEIVPGAAPVPFFPVRP